MYHLEALHHMHANENVFTWKNLLKDVGSITVRPEEITFSIRKCSYHLDFPLVPAHIMYAPSRDFLICKFFKYIMQSPPIECLLDSIAKVVFYIIRIEGMPIIIHQ